MKSCIITMTILIPLAFSRLGFGTLLVNLGLVLGVIIDIHDFITNNLDMIENN